MAGDFKKISVSTENDDEVVITAGASTGHSTAPSVQNHSAASSNDAAASVTSAADPQPQHKAADVPTKSAHPDDDSVPFAHMQKVVLAVIAVGVVAFLVYWNFIY